MSSQTFVMSIMETLRLDLALQRGINFFFTAWPRKKPSREQIARAKVVAHRGAHEPQSNSFPNGIIENTLPAFLRCKELNIWGCELDVHFTKDHIPVVHHDPCLGRIFGSKDFVIADRTWTELNGAAPAIPTLEQVIAAVGKSVHLMIEIKEPLNQKPKCIESLKSVLNGLNPIQDFHFLALDANLLVPLVNMGGYSPNLMVDVIWLDPKTTFQRFHELGHGGIAGHFLFFDQKTRKSLQSTGKQFGVGFIASQNSLYRELHLGADWVFTDRAERMQKILRLLKAA
jgi:glycerophosphoryl diester phosphodiesterase